MNTGLKVLQKLKIKSGLFLTASFPSMMLYFASIRAFFCRSALSSTGMMFRVSIWDKLPIPPSADMNQRVEKSQPLSAPAFKSS